LPDNFLLVNKILLVKDQMVGRLSWPAAHINHYICKRCNRHAHSHQNNIFIQSKDADVPLLYDRMYGVLWLKAYLYSEGGDVCRGVLKIYPKHWSIFDSRHLDSIGDENSSARFGLTILLLLKSEHRFSALFSSKLHNLKIFLDKLI
jgi:hypothetical protein